MDEREIFMGSENTLTMRQTYTHEFQCSFKLAKYPFDRQICSIEMKTTDIDAPTMRLIPKQLFMEQHVDLTLFHIDNWKLAYTNKNEPQKGNCTNCCKFGHLDLLEIDDRSCPKISKLPNKTALNMILTEKN